MSPKTAPRTTKRSAPRKRAEPKVAAVGLLHGIGVDLVEIARMEGMLQRQGGRLLDKLLMPAERREVSKRNDRARALAMCWAAKEACVKALGTGFSGVGFRDVGVLRADNGRPQLVFSVAQRKRLTALGVGAAHVSLSDDAGMACAYVILERSA